MENPQKFPWQARYRRLEYTLGNLPRCWQRCRDIPDAAFLLPQNDFSGWCGKKRERGGILKAKIALAAAGAATPLNSHSPIVTPIPELQLPRVGWVWSRHGPTAGLPDDLACGGILQPSALPKESGMKRNPKASETDNTYDLNSGRSRIGTWTYSFS